MIHRMADRAISKARLFAFILYVAASGTARAQTTAVNPLKGDLGVHDPVMIKAGSTYYIFATGNGVSVKTSTDRITWRNAGRAFATAPSWHAQQVPGADGSLWAPDISFRDGKYWLYYSISTFGSRVSAIGLATTAALNSASGATQWQDQGMVVHTTSTSNHNAIDPNIVQDEAGVPWLFYGSFWTGLKAIKLDPATGKPAAAAPLISTAQHTAGIEAPFVIRRGGWFHQFVSWDACCKGASSTYNIRAGRSAKVDGPYADSKGTLMTAGGGDLIDKGDTRWKGPGPQRHLHRARHRIPGEPRLRCGEQRGLHPLDPPPVLDGPGLAHPGQDPGVHGRHPSAAKGFPQGARIPKIPFDLRGRRVPETGLRSATPIFLHPNRSIDNHRADRNNPTKKGMGRSVQFVPDGAFPCG